MFKCKNYIPKGFILLISILFFGACRSADENYIRIGILNGPTVASFIKMIADKPQFNGKNIEFVVKDEPQQIQALILKDDLDFAVLPTVMAVNLYNKGLKFRMAACPVWGTLYILTNEKIQDTLDISNKDIYIFGQGGTADILLQKYIEDYSFENVGIDYSYNSNQDLAQALLSSKIHYAIISEPMASMLLSRNSNIRIVSKLHCEEYIFNKETDIFVQTAFVVNDRFWEHNENTTKAICEKYAESCSFANDYPQRTINLLEKYGYVRPGSLSPSSIKRCNIKYFGAFGIEKELTEYLKLFYNFEPKSIGDKMPDSKFIYQQNS